MKLDCHVESWPRKAPLRITGYVFETVETLRVTVSEGGSTGQGEASGVYYLGETVTSIASQVEGVRDAVEAGLSRQALQALLPAGGARNAIDCALWDLEAKLTGVPVWDRAGLALPRPILTTYTIGADAPDAVAKTAISHASAKALKLKLTGDACDVDRIRAVRSARPDVWIGVDANQGFTTDKLEAMMPIFVECGIELIEQPFPIGEEHWLDNFQSPIPIAADESVQTSADLDEAVGRFDVINIKLDKAGGFTEALAMARRAETLGFGIMVGNMMGTSLAMAPPFLLAQLCTTVDLDGPMFLRRDRAPAARFDNGRISVPLELWG